MWFLFAAILQWSRLFIRPSISLLPKRTKSPFYQSQDFLKLPSILPLRLPLLPAK